MYLKIFKLMAALTAVTSPTFAQNTFDAESDLSSLAISGNVSIDSSLAYAGGGSLKVDPGASVTIPVFSGDEGGVVTLYYYDDLTVPAVPTERRVGPLFGLGSTSGLNLAVGGIYAPYLASDGLNHVTSFLDTNGTGNWFGVIQYLQGATRVSGWSKWTFDMDPTNGLSIYQNDVLISSFNWSLAPLPGISTIFIEGDPGSTDTQTIWIDEITVTSKGRMLKNPDGSDIVYESEFIDIEFDSTDDLDNATVNNASIDTSFALDGAGSLKIIPGSSVHLPISVEEQAASVTLYQFDNGQSPTDPLARRTGLRFGLGKANGTVLAIGGMYAPYISGNTHYVTSWYDSSSNPNWFTVQHLSQATRSEGWHKWVFDLDPDNGLTLYYDNVLVTAFDWNSAPLIDFNQLVFLGDADDAEGQTFWIDNVTIELKGPSNIDPELIDPIAPPSDPDYDGPALGLIGNLVNEHPRLLFTADDLPAMKAFYAERTNRHSGVLSGVANAATGWTPSTKFLTDATEGQRVGLWYLPSLALNYLLSGNTDHLNKAISIMEFITTQPNWETGGETDTGMSAGNIMGGMALAYDWLYDDLDPTFRETVRQQLWTHARRMYHSGHLVGSYWTSDPQNNHRFHRNYGLVLSVLAAFKGNENQMWMLSETMKEIGLIAKWLPYDGSNHESIGYQVFGLPLLYTACQAADHTLGTNYLDQGYFKNMGLFWAMSLTPEMNKFTPFGDASNGLAYYSYPLYAIAAKHKQGNFIALYDQVKAENPSAFSYAWMGLIGYKGEPATSFESIPHAVHFPDIDAAFFKDGFSSDGISAMFKSGPTGGDTLNQYRDQNDFSYINVAHDDPDANSFTIWGGGDYLAATDAYSYKKQSANHNTILVNGSGQQNPGRPEGGQWTQPSTASASMSGLANIVNWKDEKSIVLVEGEAANYYSGSVLNRYRRSFIWNEGKYILVLDDIRGNGAQDITWLLQAPTLTAENESTGQYILANNSTSESSQVVATQDYSASIVDSPADNRNTPIGYDQLRLQFDQTTDLKLANIHTPWGGTVTVSIDNTDANNATVTVTGEGFVDIWTWQAASDASNPSSLQLTSNSGQSFNSVPEIWTTNLGGWNYRIGGDSDWFHNDAFGYVYPKSFPWIYQVPLGWIYSNASNTEESKYFWNDTMGWIWTSNSYYPWVYQYNLQSWEKIAQ